MLKKDLEIAVSRLDTKISIMEMQMNSTTKPGNWPNRFAWRSLIRMAQNVVDEYYKENENGASKSD